LIIFTGVTDFLRLFSCKMKKKIRFYFMILTLVSVTVINSCIEPYNLPEINTVEISLITPVSASCRAVVRSGISSEITEKGICWSTLQSASISGNRSSGSESSESGDFTANLSGLLSNTTYYVRGYATTPGGTAYGNELSFTTPVDHSGEKGTVTDIEGNIYSTIGIGSQIWTAGNIRTSLLNDNTAIIYGQCYRCWSFLTSPGYCWYDNYEFNKNTLGALYNFYSVSSMKLCPTGWHVPSDEEWTTLENYLADKNPITALDVNPGGFRGDLATFSGVGENSVFWTSSKVSTDKAIYREISLNKPAIIRGIYPVLWGASVRCIKNTNLVP
jgi:hypothetical protein